MSVSGDDDGRPGSPGEGRKHRPEEPVTRVFIEGVRVDVEAEGGGEVAHGTEWTRRGEGVAGGPQHRGRPSDLAAELVGQGGLARPGLAAHEHQATLACRGLAQMPSEVIQVVFAFK
jgi:hypothetical protein